MTVDVVRFAFRVLLPIWALAGFGDYLCHRATRIDRTPFGLGESSLHLLQWAQIVAAVSLLVWLPPGPVAFSLAALCVLAHSATAWWDESRTRPQRRISRAEHHCHAYLIVAPVAALLLAAWAGVQPGPPARALSETVPLGVVYAAFAAAGLLVVEEWLRCLRGRVAMQRP